jgi:hypothetical protein
MAERHSASVDGGGASSSSGSGAGTGVFAGNSRHGAQLQAQQEQVSEMRVLMRKDMLLRGAMAMHLQGCMSWRQQAKLRVMMVSEEGARRTHLQQPCVNRWGWLAGVSPWWDI